MIQQQLEQPSVQQLGPSLEAPPPANQGPDASSYESIPGTAGHEQLVTQATGYGQTSPTSPMHQATPSVSAGMSGKNGQPSSGGPSRSDPPLVQPAVPPSTQPGAISLTHRRLSAPLPTHRRLSAPLPTWVERARNTAASPSQNTCTIESSNSGPDSAPVRGQPQADADVAATGPRPELRRPQSIHDPRYYTAADIYGLSPLPQSPFNRNGP